MEEVQRPGGKVKANHLDNLALVVSHGVVEAMEAGSLQAVEEVAAVVTVGLQETVATMDMVDLVVEEMVVVMVVAVAITNHQTVTNQLLSLLDQLLNLPDQHLNLLDQ